jgi:hypothetical protein
MFTGQRMAAKVQKGVGRSSRFSPLPVTITGLDCRRCIYYPRGGQAPFAIVSLVLDRNEDCGKETGARRLA